MKIKTLRKYIPITNDNVEVNPTVQIENYFFERHHVPGEPDYRDQAINFSCLHHLPVTATQNNGFNLITRFIRFLCPGCSCVMEQATGGGNGCEQTVEFRCKNCKVVATLTIPVPDGISFHFTDAKED